MSFDPTEISYVDIYPPIAVARVGDSPAWYLGTQIPGKELIPEGGFKDADHKIKRQGVLFRVYAFDANNQVLGEVVDDGQKYQMEWKVHVANKKSAWVRFRGKYSEEQFVLRNSKVQGWPNGQEKTYEYTNTRDKLIIDSGEKIVNKSTKEFVPLQGSFYGSHAEPTLVRMGEVKADADGRLIFVAGDGFSYALETKDKPPSEQPRQKEEFDNDDWVDSMCDGHVTVSVKYQGALLATKNRATILTAPPKFTSGLQCPTTLLELVEEIYERKKRSEPGYKVPDVNFHRDIAPLFNRIYQMSWTNHQANTGHGPKKSQLWINNSDLYDPKTTDTDVRKDIFERVRVPVNKLDPVNEKLREEQAEAHYMPRISGDAGDFPESGGPRNADRWQSLTRLQYDQLKKWADGEFVTGEPIVPPATFESIDPKDQPAALTTAALQWSVGGPLYPGIECFWIAEDDKSWDLTSNVDESLKSYRFSETIKPGDLGKGLALPWQTDFFMCNTHWWPSVRPDNIITEEHFLKVKDNFVGSEERIAANLTKRTGWDDGLKRESGDDDTLGNSEMTRKWMRLGFIAQVHYSDSPDHLPIYIEKERDPTLERLETN